MLNKVTKSDRAIQFSGAADAIFITFVRNEKLEIAAIALFHPVWPGAEIEAFLFQPGLGGKHLFFSSDLGCRQLTGRWDGQEPYDLVFGRFVKG